MFLEAAPPIKMSRSRAWDIFCRIVDNYGDAAVCWRLARQLADEHDAAVRLWMSDLEPLNALCPAVATGVARQSVAGVEVRAWSSTWAPIEPAEIVIEAFGCGLPEDYVRAMAKRTPPPLWIVLEYLSAERWVPEHHGLPSPHPRWPIPRYFFFPGFVAGTGGVLREAGLLDRRDAFGEQARRMFWKSIAFDPPRDDAAVVSVFAYEGVPIEALLSVWAAGEVPVVACVPLGRLAPRIARDFGRTELKAGQTLARGSLELRLLRFVAQHQYDELIWSCDCNFVRGEDSFVRAQWGARPFVWNVYPQPEGAHWRKLEAFLDLYCAALPPETAASVRQMWKAWNCAPGLSVEQAWQGYWSQREVLARHARQWTEALAVKSDLAANLAQFSAERLQY